MWQERADYGHFFYRISSGESAADAYDRVSGFNESLWRSFGEDDFASVCVLVTHGLMTRVFLMKWYHFSVEYFEDLRNMNHCEFVVMKMNPGSQKYVLQNQLRTWSEMRRERVNSRQEPQSPIPVRKKWGGCNQPDGEWGDDFARRQAARRQNTADLFGEDLEKDMNDAKRGSNDDVKARSSSLEAHDTDPSSYTDAGDVMLPAPKECRRIPSPYRLDILRGGRDGGGSRSGAASPNRSLSEDSDADVKECVKRLPVRGSLALAMHHELGPNEGGKDRIRADALGDQSDVEDDDDVTDKVENMRKMDQSFEGAVR